MNTILDKIEPVSIPKPSDIVLKQIKNIIGSGELKPGDKLPPERILAERFGIGRSHIREAIKKLEFYGIVKTLPQSGTVVANLGVNLIEGLIANVLQLEKDDFEALIETRCILETDAARLAAERSTEKGIAKLREVLENYSQKIRNGIDGLEEDLLFHLQIAELSKNSVLRSILTLITPEVVNLSKRLDTCKNDRTQDALSEHEAIFKAIAEHNPQQAEAAMMQHMKNTMNTVNY